MAVPVLIVSLVGFTVFALRVANSLFTSENELKALDMNMAAFCLAVAIGSVAVIGASDYRDTKRVEERETLREVASVQRQILKEESAFGGKPDVLRRKPELFKFDFEVETGMSGDTAMLRTPRCEMALFPSRALGPTCGSK